MSSVKGSVEFERMLSSYSKRVQTDVKELVEYTLGEIELDAQRAAPGGGDPIKTQQGTESQTQIARGRSWTPISQAIGYTVYPDGYGGAVFVEKSAGVLAAYVEFGTGQSAATYLATVPAEWKATAQTYYVNGLGTIIAQPYLFPAFLTNKIQYIKDLKKILGKF